MKEKLTPLMRQYLDIKEKHPDDILFFRLGDFYEMFFDDAHSASSILDITLTRRNEVPMCGIPYHSSENYIARIIRAGKTVAICEQMESTPSEGTVVKREVVRVITPGTINESSLLSGDANNYLASVVIGDAQAAIAYADISTGDFFITVIKRDTAAFRSELARIAPREALYHDASDSGDSALESELFAGGISRARINDWLYDPQYLDERIRSFYGVSSVRGMELEGETFLAAGSLIEYIRQSFRAERSMLKLPRVYSPADYLILDESAVRNLDLVRNSEGTRERTLLAAMDRTQTAGGKRFLERNILRPLVNPAAINERLDMVELLTRTPGLFENILGSLSAVKDIERIIGRVVAGRENPQELRSLSDSLKSAGALAHALAPHAAFAALAARINPCAELTAHIDTALVDEPPVDLESGRAIREGYHAELDRLYGLKNTAKEWVTDFENREKERLGIPTLKVRYNRVFGYYIEISKGQAAKAPEEYLRKQTLVNAERFTTPELQRYETEILDSSEKALELERSLFRAICDEAVAAREAILETALAAAECDFLAAAAQNAIERNYVRPVFNEENTIRITAGRHPVVERHIREPFIPNDLEFAPGGIIKVITGPNMAGKSTYIRTVAVLQIMAQCGSFVPADMFDTIVADRVYARIGASDNIARGESTFLVEMSETAAILNTATDRSLIIMDEVGRGTSTYDGLSIAQAIIEYIVSSVKGRTLFATHYHELTALESPPAIENLTVAVQERAGGVEFLHRVIRGPADKSYGIHVASLAGIPREVTARAKKHLERFEKKSSKVTGAKAPEASDALELFNASNHIVLKTLSSLDPDRMTPIEALAELSRLKRLVD